MDHFYGNFTGIPGRLIRVVFHVGNKHHWLFFFTEIYAFLPFFGDTQAQNAL